MAFPSCHQDGVQPAETEKLTWLSTQDSLSVILATHFGHLSFSAITKTPTHESKTVVINAALSSYPKSIVTVFWRTIDVLHRLRYKVILNQASIPTDIEMKRVVELG